MDFTIRQPKQILKRKVQPYVLSAHPSNGHNRAHNIWQTNTEIQHGYSFTNNDSLHEKVSLKTIERRWGFTALGSWMFSKPLKHNSQECPARMKSRLPRSKLHSWCATLLYKRWPDPQPPWLIWILIFCGDYLNPQYISLAADWMSICLS